MVNLGYTFSVNKILVQGTDWLLSRYYMYCYKFYYLYLKEIEMGINEQKVRSAHGEQLSTELFISNRDSMEKHKDERIRGTMHY